MNAEDSQVLDFRGRVALVTGAASGMGAATAKELAARGAHVVVVSDAFFCQGAVASAVARHGRLDILVNCAGIIVRADASDTSDDDWRRIIDVNVGGVFFMSRAAVAIMQIQKRGAIVNFGSIWGDVGAAGVVAYCASKGAVHQLTRAMALDHVGDGIRINAVAPGEVNTPMLAFGRAAAPSAAELQKLADETIPMRRLADPIEIARVVAFLASDSASYMTGTIVTVDAGYTAR
jgi:NAD(P)-dependent dehydrogenase (short-subunit alcohol dehydrogenase family)